MSELLSPEKQPGDEREDRQQHREAVADNIGEEIRRVDFRVVGNRFHHEVRAIADIGHRAEEGGTEGDGLKVMSAAGQKGCHISGAIEGKVLMAESSGEERETGGALSSTPLSAPLSQ